MSADHVSEREAPEAGRELDALIAEKVMDFPVMWMATALSPNQPHYRNSKEGSGWLWCRPYSTDIAAAWLVVEKMRENGWRYCLVGYVSTPLQECVFERGLGREADRFIAGAETLPLAICRAALAVAGSPTEEDTRAVSEHSPADPRATTGGV